MLSEDFIKYSVNKSDKRKLPLILAVIFTFINFSIDNFMPSSLSISKYYNVPLDYIQFGYSIFFSGSFIALFLSILNMQRIKRKTMFTIGAWFLILGQLACLISYNYNTFIIGRLLFGIGYGFIAMYCVTCLTDCFKGRILSKSLAIITLVLSLVVVIAPFVGGIIEDLLGWRYNFAVSFIFSVIVFILGQKYLPETSIHYEKLYPFKKCIHNIIQPLRELRFLKCATISILSGSTVYIYIALGPAIFLKLYKLTPIQYGGFYIYLSIALIGSSLLNNYLLKSKSYLFIILNAIVVSLIGLLLMAMIYFYNISSVYIFLISITLSIFGFYLIAANMMPISLSKFNNKFGTASGVFLVIRTLGIAVITPLVSILNYNEIFILFLIFTVFLIIIFCIIINLFKQKIS